MKGKIPTEALVILAVLVLTSGVLLAQKVGHHPVSTKRIHAEFSDAGRGQAWMGVRLSEVTADKARELKLPDERGAVVSEVDPDGPASKAGLQANDVILEFDGERVRSVPELRRLVRETPAGRKVSLKVSRAGEMRTLSVTLAARHELMGFQGMHLPDVAAFPKINVPAFNFNFWVNGAQLGISAQELTPQLADYFGVKGRKGVLVLEVKSGTAAEKGGLKAGDCIIKVDSTEVGSIENLHNAISRETVKDAEKQEHTLTIVRDHREQSLKVEIEPRRSHVYRENAEVLTPEPPEPPEPPEILAPEIEDLEDDISELQARAPEMKLQAERLAQELKNYQGAHAEAARAEVQKLAQQLKQQREIQLTDQARRQIEEVKRQILEETKQQRELQQHQNQYRELLEQMMGDRDTV
jgi:serine protease Do